MLKFIVLLSFLLILSSRIISFKQFLGHKYSVAKEPASTNYSISYYQNIAENLCHLTVASYCNYKKGLVVQTLPKLKNKTGKYQNIPQFNRRRVGNNRSIIRLQGNLPWDLKNWIEDIDFIPTAYPLCDNGQQVHERFYKDYFQIQKSVRASVITRNSLGGSLATLAAADMMMQGKNILHFCTFGCPRVEDPKFETWMENKFINKPKFRITYGSDPVPHLPPSNFNFKCITTQVFYEYFKFKGFKICDDSKGQDPKCSNKYNVDLNIPDHLSYLDIDFAVKMPIKDLIAVLYDLHTYKIKLLDYVLGSLHMPTILIYQPRLLDGIHPCKSTKGPENRAKQKHVYDNIGTRIINDITTTVFNENFVMRLMLPQQPLTVQILKNIFKRLAHSSTMKLDKGSMQKLFYLMLMTFKKQVFLTSSPLQLYTLTVNHIQSLRFYTQSEDVKRLLNNVLQIFKQGVKKFSYMQYFWIKEELLTILQGYQTRIANLIETKQQNQKGHIIYFARNSHNKKSIGSGFNHSEIEELRSCIKDQSLKPSRNLDYQNYTQWKTLIGVNSLEYFSNNSGNTEKKQSNNDKQKQFLKKHNAEDDSGMQSIKKMLGISSQQGNQNYKENKIKVTQQDTIIKSTFEEKCKIPRQINEKKNKQVIGDEACTIIKENESLNSDKKIGIQQAIIQKVSKRQEKQQIKLKNAQENEYNNKQKLQKTKEKEQRVKLGQQKQQNQGKNKSPQIKKINNGDNIENIKNENQLSSELQKENQQIKRVNQFIKKRQLDLIESAF